jgi:hypothetical protein
MFFKNHNHKKFVLVYAIIALFILIIWCQILINELHKGNLNSISKSVNFATKTVYYIQTYNSKINTIVAKTFVPTRFPTKTFSVEQQLKSTGFALTHEYQKKNPTIFQDTQNTIEALFTQYPAPP